MSEVKFETQLSRLQEIVSKLESGNTDLDESLALYQEGIQLSKKLSALLKEYDQKIEEINQENNHE